MAYTAIGSDPTGRLYWIDHEGRLQRLPDGDPNGEPETLGDGWMGVEEFGVSEVDGRVSLLARQYDRRYAAMGADGRPEPASWRVTGDPTEAARPRILRSISGVPDGSFLGVTGSPAQLVEVRTAPLEPEPALGLPRQGIEVLSALNSVGRPSSRLIYSGTRVFTVNRLGQLCYRANRIGEGDLGTWVVLEAGWNIYQRVLSAGPAALYTISGEGEVLRRPYHDDGAVVTLVETERDVLREGLVGWFGLPSRVEAYAVPLSLAPGSTVQVHIAARLSNPAVTVDVNCSVDLVRLQRANDCSGSACDGQPIASTQVTAKPAPAFLPNWTNDGAGWPVAATFNLRGDLPSGIYAARCTDGQGERFYAPFIVRPRQKERAFAVIANTNTWNAYNSWGDMGKYRAPPSPPFTYTFERPHPGLHPETPPEGELTSQSLHLLRAELWVLGWLDSLPEAYRYDVYSDFDVHNGIEGLQTEDPDRRYKALVLSTHPEYWSCRMYSNVQQYLGRGGNLLYLGGNGLFEAADFASNGALRAFPNVPFTGNTNQPHNHLRRLSKARNIGMPEHALTGVGYFAMTSGQPYHLLVNPADSPALSGVRLRVGNEFGRTGLNGVPANGWEVDQRDSRWSPHAAFASPHALLAQARDASSSGDMLFYETGHIGPSGASGVVFSASSLNFGGSLAVDTTLQQIVRNVLDIALTR